MNEETILENEIEDLQEKLEAKYSLIESVEREINCLKETIKRYEKHRSIEAEKYWKRTW